MKLTITDPSEPAPHGDGTWTGYWSAEIEDHGGLVANINLAPSEVPDVEDPEDLAEFFEEAAAGARAMTDAVDDLE